MVRPVFGSASVEGSGCLVSIISRAEVAKVLASAVVRWQQVEIARFFDENREPKDDHNQVENWVYPLVN